MEDCRIITFEDMPGWDKDFDFDDTACKASVKSSNSTSPTSSASANNSANSNTNSANSNKQNNNSANSNTSNNTAIGASAQPAVASLTLQGNSLSFTTARAASVSLDVFDLQGNRVMGLYKGALSAGTHQFSLSGMARGSYIVRAKGTGLSAMRQIVIK